MAKQVLTEAGEWREGSASPRQLPEELRSLPGELVTKDADDPDKAHDLDAPHVVRQIVGDFVKANAPEEPKPKTAKEELKKLWAPGPGESAPVRQWFVDVAKMRVIATLVRVAVARFQAGGDPDLTPCHLWFNSNNVNDYCLRMGNPPSNRDRPKFLRDIDLVIDVMKPPRSIMEEFKKRGVDFDPVKLVEQTRQETRLVHLV